MEYLFPPSSSGHLRLYVHQSQIIGADADIDHTQTVGEIQSNYWGDISPIPPPGFETPVWQEDLAKVSKVPEAQRGVNPTRQ